MFANEVICNRIKKKKSETFLLTDTVFKQLRKLGDQ